MTRNERELHTLRGNLSYLPIQIKQTRLAGCELRKAKKELRKKKINKEKCLRACNSLPKHWTSYHNLPGIREKYSRQEVTDLHKAIHSLEFGEQWAIERQKSYDERYIKRDEYRKELKKLPALIEFMSSLVEIERKRRKPSKKQEIPTKWLRISEEYIIEKAKVNAYTKTINGNITKTISDNYLIFSHNTGYIKLIMTPINHVPEMIKAEVQ